MNPSIQNYGFTKTYISNNNQVKENEIKWKGHYDGNLADVNININDNGHTQDINIQLDNNDLMNLLGIQPVSIPLEQRLIHDFYPRDSYPSIPLEGALLPSKKTKRRHKRHKKHKHHKITHRYRN